MGKIQSFKQRVGETALVVLDVVCTVVPGAGAVAAAFLGRAMLAAVLVAIALGFFLRFARSRRPKEAAPPPVPLWARGVAGVIAVVVVSALVEATNFPVRFDQPGFEAWHWALVLLVGAFVYSFAANGVQAIIRKQGAEKP